MIKMRVAFEKGAQKLFFSKILKGISLKKFCALNGLTYSTFKQYYRGDLTIPLDVFKTLTEASNIDLTDFDYKIIPSNWWQSQAGKKGIKALFQKYSKKTLNKWRSIAWKKLKSCNLTDVILPEKINENLAELVGVYLGDGTLTQYFIRISGDKRFDLPYFEYLTDLTERVFGVKPTIRKDTKTNQLCLEIRSKKICDYFQKEFYFKTGDKINNHTQIPEQIMADKNLFFACLRGLVDTDGSVSKDGGILSIRFTNHNKALMKQLKETQLLKDIFTIKSNPRETGTRSFGNVKKYFSLVGSSNLRHIIRYCEYAKRNLLKRDDVLNYYKEYQNTSLPFKK